VVGQHEGIVNYTIGQRRGLALAMGYPIYVTHLDPDRNAVTVGGKDQLQHVGLEADRLNWLSDPPTASRRVEIKIRHQHTPASGELVVTGNDGVRATFDEPQLAVTPGQAAVFYGADDLVLGGGWIRRPVTGDPEAATCR
jgi:tRNA-specific 2-thiouridylase